MDTSINNYKCKLCGKFSGGYSLCYNCRENFDKGIYLTCIKCSKFKEDDKKLCKQCEERTKSENINIIQKKQEEIKSSELRDYRKKFDARYKTIDGHYVRSRGEVMIADFYLEIRLDISMKRGYVKMVKNIIQISSCQINQYILNIGVPKIKIT